MKGNTSTVTRGLRLAVVVLLTLIACERVYAMDANAIRERVLADQAEYFRTLGSLEKVLQGIEIVEKPGVKEVTGKLGDATVAYTFRSVIRNEVETYVPEMVHIERSGQKKVTLHWGTLVGNFSMAQVHDLDDSGKSATYLPVPAGGGVLNYQNAQGLLLGHAVWDAAGKLSEEVAYETPKAIKWMVETPHARAGGNMPTPRESVGLRDRVLSGHTTYYRTYAALAETGGERREADVDGGKQVSVKIGEVSLVYLFRSVEKDGTSELVPRSVQVDQPRTAQVRLTWSPEAGCLAMGVIRNAKNTFDAAVYLPGADGKSGALHYLNAKRQAIGRAVWNAEGKMTEDKRYDTPRAIDLGPKTP